MTHEQEELFGRVDRYIDTARSFANELKSENTTDRETLIDPCYTAIRSARELLAQGIDNGYDIEQIVLREDEIRRISASILHGLL